MEERFISFSISLEKVLKGENRENEGKVISEEVS